MRNCRKPSSHCTRMVGTKLKDISLSASTHNESSGSPSTLMNEFSGLCFHARFQFPVFYGGSAGRHRCTVTQPRPTHSSRVFFLPFRIIGFVKCPGPFYLSPSRPREGRCWSRGRWHKSWVKPTQGASRVPCEPLFLLSLLPHTYTHAYSHC